MAIFLLLGKNKFSRTRTVLPIRVATGLWATEPTQTKRVRRGRPKFVRVRVSRAAIYIAVRCVAPKHPNQSSLPHLVPCAAIVVYFIPSAGVHRRLGEEVFGTNHLCDP